VAKLSGTAQMSFRALQLRPLEPRSPIRDYQRTEATADKEKSGPTYTYEYEYMLRNRRTTSYVPGSLNCV
jgi:hypothetical protein